MMMPSIRGSARTIKIAQKLAPAKNAARRLREPLG